MGIVKLCFVVLLLMLFAGTYSTYESKNGHVELSIDLIALIRVGGSLNYSGHDLSRLVFFYEGSAPIQHEEVRHISGTVVVRSLKLRPGFEFPSVLQYRK